MSRLPHERPRRNYSRRWRFVSRGSLLIRPESLVSNRLLRYAYEKLHATRIDLKL